MAAHSSILAWRIHGQRSLVGYTVQGVAKSQTQLKWLSTPAHSCLKWVFQRRDLPRFRIGRKGSSGHHRAQTTWWCFSRETSWTFPRGSITIKPFALARVSWGEGYGTPLQYSCLENPMDGGAWWAAVHRVAKSQTQLSNFTFTFHFHALEKEMATHSSVLAWRIPGTGSLVGCHLWSCTGSDTTEAT